MNIIKPLLISTTLLFSSNSFANDNKHEEGEKLFKSTCDACHGMTGGMDMNKRIAPPIAGVRKHYIDAYPDEAAFVGAITSWLEKQDESKTLMPGAIQKFKLMPPLVVPKEDAAKIAAYIYSGNIEKPEGLDHHMDEMHNKMGKGQHKMGQMGKGKGKNMQGCQMDHQGKGMQRGHMMGGMKNSMQGKRGKKLKMMMKQLNLSPQQKQKMQLLIKQKRAIIQPLKRELQQINQTVRLLDTTNLNYKQMIFSLADQKAKLVYRMVIEKGEKRMEIESVLNPQQRAQFRNNRQQYFESRQH